MADSLSNFFSELSSVIGDFLGFIFNFIFVNLYDHIVYHGENVFNFIANLADTADIATLFTGNFIFFILGLPIIFFLIKLIVNIIRG